MRKKFGRLFAVLFLLFAWWVVSFFAREIWGAHYLLRLLSGLALLVWIYFAMTQFYEWRSERDMSP